MVFVFGLADWLYLVAVCLVEFAALAVAAMKLAWSVESWTLH